MMGEDFEVTLRESVDMMFSENYKERFIAEYVQINIRCNRLRNMLYKWQRNELGFEPDCPYDTLHTQLVFMEAYRNTLEGRAMLEQIDLP